MKHNAYSQNVHIFCTDKQQEHQSSACGRTISEVNGVRNMGKSACNTETNFSICCVTG